MAPRKTVEAPKPTPKGISAFHAAEIEQRFKALQLKYNSGGCLPRPPAFDRAWLQPRPGMVPKGAKLAMDFNPVAGIGWGGWGAASTEGTIFFGYQYLAELTQRAEFRLLTETISEEVTRRWGEVKAAGGADKSDKVNAIEREFKRLKVRDKFRHADELDNYFGRGHMYLDFGQGDQEVPDDELKMPVGDGWSNISQSKCSPQMPLRDIRVIEPMWVWPGIYNSTNPLRADYYNPATWWVQVPRDA